MGAGRITGAAGERGGLATLRLTLIAVLMLWMAILAAITAGALLRLQPWGADFAPMWTAARGVWRGHGSPYDFAVVSAAQDWLLGPVHKLRPFAYPPSALVVMAPFGLVEFWPSLVLWCVAGFAANAWASSRVIGFGAMRFRAIDRLPTVALALALPAATFVLVSGQVTLLIAALSLAGLAWLERRPAMAGVAFGLALALKPSSLVLLPIALVAARAWRPLAIAALTAAALATFAALLFGVGAWREWLAALPRFQALVMADPGLVKRMVAPMALARGLGVAGPALTALQAALGLVAAAYVWITFRGSRDWAARMTALVGGGLICAPYAMQYETALLAAPAAMLVARAQSGPRLALGAFAYLVLALAMLPPFGGAATVVFIAIAGAMLDGQGKQAWALSVNGTEPMP